MFDVSMTGAFLAGLLSFLSPCVLPMVPFYLSYLAGVSVNTVAGGAAVSGAVRGRAMLGRVVLRGGHAHGLRQPRRIGLGAGAARARLVRRAALDRGGADHRDGSAFPRRLPHRPQPAVAERDGRHAQPRVRRRLPDRAGLSPSGGRPASGRSSRRSCSRRRAPTRRGRARCC
jgi:hypothetical protein